MDQITLSVLGYAEDGLWFAHGLEIDIVGQGDTFEDALENLKELLEMQLSFAAFKNDPSLIERPAPVEYFRLFAEHRNAILHNIVRGVVPRGDPRYRFGGIPVPSHLDPAQFAAA